MTGSQVRPASATASAASNKMFQETSRPTEARSGGVFERLLMLRRANSYFGGGTPLRRTTKRTRSQQPSAPKW